MIRFLSLFTKIFKRSIQNSRLVTCGIITIGLLCPPALANEEANVRVLVSLKPLALIAKEVLGETASITTLLPENADPHHFQAKPSQIKALSEADVFFWISPDMERFMPKLLSASKQKNAVVLYHAPEEKNGIVEAHDEHQHDDHSELARSTHNGTSHKEILEDQHDHDEDLHLWLDPLHAIDIATQMVTHVNNLYPNMADMRLQKLNEFSRATLSSLANLKKIKLGETRLLTYHNAFSLLANRLRLDIAEVLTPSTELRPGARHLAKISELNTQVRLCMISEPGTSHKYAKQLNIELQTEIDPLARSISINQSHPYQTYLSYLEDRLSRCAPYQH